MIITDLFFFLFSVFVCFCLFSGWVCECLFPVQNEWTLSGPVCCCCVASCPGMSADILGTSWDQCVSMVQCCFTSTETIRLIRTENPGRPPRLSHSSWTLEGVWVMDLCICIGPWSGWSGGQYMGAWDDDVKLNVLGCRLTELLRTSCDQCVNMVQCCFMSTETVRLFRTESPGRPPRFSHSSWALKGPVDLWWVFDTETSVVSREME